MRCCPLNEWLLEMDAYQHAKDGVHYPATLLIQGINDPRVPPPGCRLRWRRVFRPSLGRTNRCCCVLIMPAGMESEAPKPNGRSNTPICGVLCIGSSATPAFSQPSETTKGSTSEKKGMARTTAAQGVRTVWCWIVDRVQQPVSDCNSRNAPRRCRIS